jgi:nicotinate-nucleotide adenylyltransferase
MMRIGVFGGSFNPVHNGHVLVALRAMEQAQLDRLLVIPVAEPPHKELKDALPGELRLNLLSLAFAGVPGVEVDATEIRRGGKSYTVDTLRSLRDREPPAHWFFVLGGDSLANLGSWREAQVLLSELTFVAYPREGAKNATAPAGARVQFLTGAEFPNSSTEIRERMRRGSTLRGLVPECVEARLHFFCASLDRVSNGP